MNRFAIVCGVIVMAAMAVLIAGNSPLLAERTTQINSSNSTGAGNMVNATVAVGDTQYFYYADGVSSACNGTFTVWFQPQQGEDNIYYWQNATSVTLSSYTASGSFTARAVRMGTNSTNLVCGSDGTSGGYLPIYFYSWGGND